MPAQGKQLSLFGTEDTPEEADEKTQLLRDDLGRGSGFVNGKLRIAEYFEQHQPTDKELSAFLQKEYGIGGHSGPDMADVSYDSKGIHIISADKKGNYHYTWAQAAKEIRGMIERGEYITPQDMAFYYHRVLHYTQHEIAVQFNKSQVTIHDWIRQIAEIIKKTQKQLIILAFSPAI